MSETLPECEVVVVGLGASGGLVATVLAEAGLDVVGIDAGPRSHGEFTGDEIANESRNVLGSSKANHEIPTVRCNPDVEAHRATGTRGLQLMNGTRWIEGSFDLRQLEDAAVELPQPYGDVGSLRTERDPSQLDACRLATRIRRTSAVLRPGRSATAFPARRATFAGGSSTAATRSRERVTRATPCRRCGEPDTRS